MERTKDTNRKISDLQKVYLFHVSRGINNFTYWVRDPEVYISNGSLCYKDCYSYPYTEKFEDLHQCLLYQGNKMKKGIDAPVPILEDPKSDLFVMSIDDDRFDIWKWVLSS